MTGPEEPRVLVVDDEEDIRMIVGINLDLAGLGYDEAANGDEALELLRSGDYEACILDLTMPGPSGFEVLRELSGSREGDRPVIVVLSARSSPADALEALKLGAHAHVTKPFSPADLAELVGALVALGPEEREGRRREAIERAGSLARYGVRSI